MKNKQRQKQEKQTRKTTREKKKTQGPDIESYYFFVFLISIDIDGLQGTETRERNKE